MLKVGNTTPVVENSLAPAGIFSPAPEKSTIHQKPVDADKASAIFFMQCDGDVFFPHNAISIISGDILPSQSVRLFFQIIATDYFAMFF